MDVLGGGDRGAVANTDARPTCSWSLGGLALLEAIFLITLPWFHVSGGPAFNRFFGSFSIARTATEFPYGWAGVISAIAAFGVVLDIALARLHARRRRTAAMEIHADVQAVLAIVTAAFVAVKFLAHIDFAHLDWGFYVIVANSVALVGAVFWTGSPRIDRLKLADRRRPARAADHRHAVRPLVRRCQARPACSPAAPPCGWRTASDYRGL